MCVFLRREDREGFVWCFDRSKPVSSPEGAILLKVTVKVSGMGGGAVELAEGWEGVFSGATKFASLFEIPGGSLAVMSHS